MASHLYSSHTSPTNGRPSAAIGADWGGGSGTCCGGRRSYCAYFWMIA
jgi:hypothetical protein